MSWDKNVKGRSFASSGYALLRLTMMLDTRQVLARASMPLRKPKYATVSSSNAGPKADVNASCNETRSALL